MTEWWRMSQEALAADKEAQQAKQLAYYNTFYRSDSGREVLLDLQHLCHAELGSSDSILARIELFNIIRINCGISVDSEKAAIDAEAKAIM